MNPIVIDLVQQERLNLNLKVGDTIRPLMNFDFDSKNWKAFIVISNDDNYTFSDRRSIFFTENIELLKSLKSNWVFVNNGSDLATVSSDYHLYSNGNLAFTSGIVIDTNRSGLQSINYGWLTSNDNSKFYNLCLKFNKGYSPIYIFTD